MMQAVSTSATSVNFYQTTRRSIPEDSRVHFSHYFPASNCIIFFSTLERFLLITDNVMFIFALYSREYSNLAIRGSFTFRRRQVSLFVGLGQSGGSPYEKFITWLCVSRSKQN
jgi:hypothetical protein